MIVAAILEHRDGQVVTVTRDTSVTEAVKLLADRRIGAVPVLDEEGRVIGIMSERDVIHHLQSDGAAMLEWPVERVMTSPAVTIERGQSVLGALGMITERRIRHLPVVEGGKLIGLVSIGDLVKNRMDGIEREASALRDYIQSA